MALARIHRRIRNIRHDFTHKLTTNLAKTKVDLFNNGPAGLVVVLPITTKDKGIPFHMEIYPPEGGFMEKSLSNVRT